MGSEMCIRDRAIDDQLSTIVGQLSSSDWISRKEGANRLLSLARAQPEVLSRSSRLLSLVDAFTPQLSFANPKVMLAALAALEGLAPLLRRTLVPSIPTIVQALSSSLASSNAQVWPCPCARHGSCAVRARSRLLARTMPSR